MAWSLLILSQAAFSEVGLQVPLSLRSLCRQVTEEESRNGY